MVRPGIFVDQRQVAAFFLGGVFVISLNYSLVFIRSLLWRFVQWIFRRRSTSSEPSDVEHAHSEKESFVETTTDKSPTGENSTLVFTLSICFAFTSIAYFSSLLSFNPDRGEAACAFVVAWGGMAAQAARLVGLVILLLDMRHLGASRIESFVFIAWLVVGIIFVFVNNATSTGTISNSVLRGVSLCSRTPSLPTALVSSLIFFGLEIYTLVRLVSLIPPRNIMMESRSSVIKDVRVLRAFSLIFLELLTIVPSVAYTNVLGEFIPLSIGALVVLVVFNREEESTIRDSVLVPYTHRPPSASNPITRASQWLLRRSTTRSTPTATTQRSNLPSSAGDHVASTTILHPFSAQSLNDPRYGRPPAAPLHPEKPSRPDSSQSLQEGAIHVAERGKRAVPSQPVVLSFPIPNSTINTLSQARVVSRGPMRFPVPPGSSSLLIGTGLEKSLPDASIIRPEKASRSNLKGTHGEKPDRKTNCNSNRSSYGYEGNNITIGPSPRPLRRYSISTLASPGPVRGEALRDSMIDRTDSIRRVRLLTFESSFRVNDAKSLQRSPISLGIQVSQEEAVPPLPSSRPQL